MIKKLIALMFLCSVAHSATYYIAASGGSDSNAGTTSARWATFSHAFGAMSAGDTLILGDGTYTQQLSGIPSGTSGAYTNVKAETNWNATVVASAALGIGNREYIRVEGIHFDANGTGSAGNIGTSNHIKIIRCSFTGANSAVEADIHTVSIVNSSYVLMEECFAWGTGRYKFLAYQSDNIIFRRCVSRHDFHPAIQVATFCRYDSTNVEFQNCIAIDSPSVEDDSTGRFYGGIWNENNADSDITGKDLGCIFLNIKGNAITDYKILGTRTITDCIAWDCKGGVECGKLGDGTGNFTATHCTFGGMYGEAQDSSRVWGVGFMGGSYTTNHSITNSILINNRSLGISHGGTVSDYNVLYGNLGIGNYVNHAGGGTVDHGTSGYDVTNPALKGANDLCAANSNAIDPIDGNPGNATPALKWLPKIETGSDLDGAASDSGDIGATVIYKYGYDETLWGETGYEVLSSSPLWPFPNEAVIKAKMADYYIEHTYSGGGVVTGDRGFCEDGAKQLDGTSDVTLTSYIWEYLGNEMPEDIYGDPGVDVTSPTISNVSATVYTSSAVVVYTTNENADLLIDYGTTASYGSNVTSAAYTTAHSVIIGTLDVDTLYHYRITTKDSTGNTTVSSDYNFTTRETASTENTIFVATTGNDATGSGTDVSPYATIQRAVNEAVAGETVLIGNGTYAGFHSVNSGTDGNPITIKGNGNAVIVNSRNADTLDNINIENNNWIVLDTIISTDSARGGFRIVESDNCTVKNCTSINAEVWGIFSGFATDILIDSNTARGSEQQHGIYVSNSRVENDNPIIRGNNCSGNTWQGIQINGDAYAGGDGAIDGALVENNIVHDNGQKGISLISVTSSTIQNNVIYDNGITAGAGGIHLTEEPDTGIYSVGNVVINNTIIEPRIACIRLTDGSIGNTIFNNLCIGEETDGLTIIDEVTGNYISNNVDEVSDTGYFTNAATHDYTLTTGSPAIDAGVATYQGKSAATLDITGYTRPGGSAYDIGAYEVQAEAPEDPEDPEEPATIGITIQGITITGGITIGN